MSKCQNTTKLPNKYGPDCSIWRSTARHRICLTSVFLDTVKSVAVTHQTSYKLGFEGLNTWCKGFCLSHAEWAGPPRSPLPQPPSPPQELPICFSTHFEKSDLGFGAGGWIFQTHLAFRSNCDFLETEMHPARAGIWAWAVTSKFLWSKPSPASAVSDWCAEWSVVLFVHRRHGVMEAPRQSPLW